MDFEEKRRLAAAFIRSYEAAKAGLRELGILRSERTVQSDYGEWLAAQLLDLQLASSSIQKDYDATDASGHTYQIKNTHC